MSASTDRMTRESSALDRRCELLRSLHTPGAPLVLPNAWDAASAEAVVAAGFPVVATTSGGVAAALGYEDHEHAPAAEMLAAAGRIGRSVDVPMTVDAEAGYGMEPDDLVAALRDAGAAGCNLEDTNHAAGELRDPASHGAWLRAVRQAATTAHYPLVINARIDVFLSALLAGSDTPQRELLPDALRRARAYLDAGVDCCVPDRAVGSRHVARVRLRRIRTGQRAEDAARSVAPRARRSSAWRGSATGASCTATRWSSSAACSAPLRPKQSRDRRLSRELSRRRHPPAPTGRPGVAPACR